MTPREYQIWTASTVSESIPDDELILYLELGLQSECGELAAMLKRQIRDGTEPRVLDVQKELGDIAWYSARLDDVRSPLRFDWPEKYPAPHSRAPNSAREHMSNVLMAGTNLMPHWVEWHGLCVAFLGCDPSEVLALNVQKLESRKQRGAIQGSGDNR